MVQVYQVTSRGEVLSGWRQKQGTANEFTSFTANRTAKGSGSDTQKGRSGFSSDEEGSYKVGSDTKRVRNVARQPQTSYEEKFTVSLSTRGLELEVSPVDQSVIPRMSVMHSDMRALTSTGTDSCMSLYVIPCVFWCIWAAYLEPF